MAPLILLISAFVVLILLNRLKGGEFISKSFAGRAAMAFMLLFTGLAHFINSEEMIAMLPEAMPLKEEIIYATGVLELLAIPGLLVQKYSRKTSIMLILFFLCVLPANIIGSMKGVEFGGMEKGPSYLYFRIPLQLFFISWIYYFGIRLEKNE